MICPICSLAFTRTGNRQKWCTGCTEEARLRYRREYVVRNRDRVLETARRVSKAARERDPEGKRERDRRWWEKNREVLNAQRRTPEYRAKATARLREKHRADPSYRVHVRMASAVHQALREHKAGRKWEALVGYTLADLVRHLERQFARGMSWSNMGEWHIDHIRPKSGFDQTAPVQFRECWALTNLRPLWAPANQAKAARREHLL